MDNLKQFVAYGPGFSGGYDTLAEAIAVIQKNGCGGVYELMPTAERCEHGIADGDWCKQCNQDYKTARRDNGDEQTD